MLDLIYDHNCTRCPLHLGQDSEMVVCVGGSGPWDRRAMIVGEAPGENEARRGRPFQGRAGSVLDEALNEAGLGRDQVFVTNTVKCRPPANRKPEVSEEEACRVYLERELRVVDPVAVLALGNHALRALTGWWGISRFVGLWTRVPRPEKEDLLVLPCYHPAYVLRQPSLLETFEELIEDFAKVANYGLTHSLQETWEYARP